MIKAIFRRGLVLGLFFHSLLLPPIASAQLYKTTAGIRLDNEQFGLALDQKIYKQLTATAAFDARSNDLRATGLLRYHIKILGRRLNIYPGAGVHVGTYKNYGSYHGFDLLLGAEYKLLLLPVVLSFDFQPAIHSGGSHPDWWNLQSVFSIKYVIHKQKSGWFKRIFKKDDN